MLVLPGLLTGDLSTRPLRSFLRRQGYAVEGWRLGLNRGLRAGLEEAMMDRLEAMHSAAGGRRVSLVGWSLGGLYARELAKQRPDLVRCVVTLGSPFAGPPQATNAWRMYEFVSGQTIEEASRQHAGLLAEPPPVPTTSIFSRSDGVCAWRSCLNADSELAENIEVQGSHCGLGHHPAAVYAVADRLAQAEGDWRKFHRESWRAYVFPDSERP